MARGCLIARTTSAYIRTYSDSGQRTAYVEWIDSCGNKGRTEGPPNGTHMKALMDRARREGLRVKRESW